MRKSLILFLGLLILPLYAFASFTTLAKYEVDGDNSLVGTETGNTKFILYSAEAVYITVSGWNEGDNKDASIAITDQGFTKFGFVISAPTPNSAKLRYSIDQGKTWIPLSISSRKGSSMTIQVPFNPGKYKISGGCKGVGSYMKIQIKRQIGGGIF